VEGEVEVGEDAGGEIAGPGVRLGVGDRAVPVAVEGRAGQPAGRVADQDRVGDADPVRHRGQLDVAVVGVLGRRDVGVGRAGGRRDEGGGGEAAHGGS